MLTIRTLAIVGACLALAACESDAQKLQRLERDERISCLQLERVQRASSDAEISQIRDSVAFATGASKTPPRAIDSAKLGLVSGDTLLALDSRCTLAKRALATFMSGR